jgi:hypothetical protein
MAPVSGSYASDLRLLRFFQTSLSSDAAGWYGEEEGGDDGGINKFV